MAELKIKRQPIKLMDTQTMITYSGERAISMTDNPYFTTPIPTPATMKDKIKFFLEADALAKVVRSVLNTQARHDAYDDLIAGHMDWIDYIEGTSGLTLAKIQTTGYTPYSPRTQATVPPPADKPSFTIGMNTGEIFLRSATYKQANHRISYIWKMSEDQGTTWQTLPAIGNSHRKKVTGLELYKEYRFKVAFATTAGEGEYSPHITVMLTDDSKANAKQAKQSKKVANPEAE